VLLVRTSEFEKQYSSEKRSPWKAVSANDANDQSPYWTGVNTSGPVIARMLLAPSSGSNTSAAFTVFLYITEFFMDW